MDGAIRSGGVEAKLAAARAYDVWALALHDARGCIDDVRGMTSTSLESLPDVWCNEWLADCAPNDMSDAEVEAMRSVFVAEAELLLETYDGPQPWAAGY